MLLKCCTQYARFNISFPDSSVGKESACSAGDPGSIPRSGRSAGEWISYPLQYTWASLVSQLVKNLPAVWETSVWSLSWEDSLEKGTATHFSILAWRIPWNVIVHGVAKRHDWVTELNWTEKMMLWKCCSQYASKFGKFSNGHMTGKYQFPFQSQSRPMPKNVQTTAQLYSFHMLVRFFQMYKLDLEKAEEPEIKLPTFLGSLRK